MARKIFCAVGLLVAMFSAGSTVFGMQNIDTRGKRVCHGNIGGYEYTTNLVKLPPSEEMRWRIAAVGFQSYAKKSILPEQLGDQLLTTCFLQEQLENDIWYYIQTLKSPDQAIQKNYDKEIRALSQHWFKAIFTALISGASDPILDENGNQLSY
jgi:hypothetical protein